MARHDPTQLELKAVLTSTVNERQAAMIKSRFKLGLAVSNLARDSGLDVSELTITNLRLLKEGKHITTDQWKTLNTLRDEGNKGYHPEDCSDLTTEKTNDYERRVNQALCGL